MEFDFSKLYITDEIFTGNIETDTQILLDEIKQMKLHGSNNRIKLTKNMKRPISCVYGFTTWEMNNGKKRMPSKKFPGWFQTKLMTQYPAFKYYLKQFSLLYMGDFEWNQVVINKNFEIIRHKDSNNVGESYIIGLGDYTGGELCVEQNENEKLIIDIKNYPYTFNGSEKYHFVLPFEGDRYTLVFYNNKMGT